jgi:ParB family chromosome partitioning protein
LEQQQAVLDVIGAEDRAPSHAEAAKMKILSNEGRLDYDSIVSIMRDDKPPQAEHFKLPGERIHRFFPAGTSVRIIEDTIIKALELWHSKQ